MATSALAINNLVETATVSETGWSTEAPASTAQGLPLTIKARSEELGTENSPLIYSGTFEFTEYVSYAALFGTNLRQNGRWRYQLYSDAGMTQLVYDSRNSLTGLDKRVIPSLYNWRQLRAFSPNLLYGDLLPSQFALYPVNVHCALPEFVRAKAFKWSLWGPCFDPDGEEADYTEIGYAWASDLLRFTIGRSNGSTDSYQPADEVKSVPGGGTYSEPGTGARKTSIALEFINDTGKEDSDTLTDLSRSIGYTKPVVWLPDTDNPTDMFRFGFVGQRRNSDTKTWEQYEYSTTSVELEEIVV